MVSPEASASHHAGCDRGAPTCSWWGAVQCVCLLPTCLSGTDSYDGNMVMPCLLITCLLVLCSSAASLESTVQVAAAVIGKHAQPCVCCHL